MSSPPAAASAARQLRARLGLGGFQQEDHPNVVEGFPAVACSDTENPDSVEAWVRAADQAAHASPHFGRVWTWTSSICQPWPGHDADRYLGPFTARTANPVLIVGTVADPATPYRGAVTLSRLLPNSRLLTLDGWGHISVVVGSSCVDARVNAYLLTGQVPPRGTVCQPDVIPFAQPASALRAAGRPAAHAALIPPVLRRPGL
jgi:hypothetical protein